MDPLDDPQTQAERAKFIELLKDRFTEVSGGRLLSSDLVAHIEKLPTVLLAKLHEIIVTHSKCEAKSGDVHAAVLEVCKEFEEACENAANAQRAEVDRNKNEG